MNAKNRIVSTRTRPVSARMMLVVSLILVIIGCNLPTQSPPSSEAAPSGPDQTGYKRFWEGKGFRLEWDETPPGAGVRFNGFAYACSIDDEIKIVEATISGDVGDDTMFYESNNASAMSYPYLDVVPLGGAEVPAQPFIRTDQADLTLEGTVTTKKGCVCTVVQELQIVFKIDFQANLAWIMSAPSPGGVLSCPPCEEHAAAVPFMPMSFANDLPIDLMAVSQSDCRTARTENP